MELTKKFRDKIIDKLDLNCQYSELDLDCQYSDLYDLLDQFKKEIKEEALILAKSMTEHLNQDERNEWFNVQLTKQ